MNERRLHELAEAAGLSIDWVDADNRDQRVSPEVLRGVLAELGLPADSDADIDASLDKLRSTSGGANLPPLLTVDRHHALDLQPYFSPGERWMLTLEDGERREGRLDDQARLQGVDRIGYHQVSIGDRHFGLAVAPAHCPTVTEIAGEAAWGLTVQLYGLAPARRRRPRRHPGARGPGAQCRGARRACAGHQSGACDVQRTHRAVQSLLALQPAVLQRAALRAGQHPRRAAAAPGHRILRSGRGVGAAGGPGADRLAGVARSRQRLLRALYDDFRTGGNAQAQDFESFRAAGGEALENHCRFEALHGHMLSAEGHPQHWRHWPEHYRDPGDPAVKRFADEHADEVSYHAFCQWLMARGLERAQQAAKAAGMPIGLVADLAVGADGGGSQAWSRQGELLASLSVGAPPDIMNRDGQNWGISAFSPWGLKQHGFRAFIEMLRANLAHAGGMRIDHVLGLKRLWVMPAGADPKQGVYLNFPFDDMLRLLCLEAWRHGAVILGEDLGTIPPGLRDVLAARGVLGMRVLLFEQHNGHFQAPQQYSAQALATTTTHDIPTIAGWWQGRDIDWRIRVGQVREEDRTQQRHAREHERGGLNHALRADSGAHGHELLSTEQAVDASVGFLGHTPAPLVLLPVEDALGLEEQPNMPGIVEIHPNWQRRYPGDSATLLDGPVAARRLARLAEARGATRSRNR